MRVGTNYNLIRMSQAVENARENHSKALEPLATGRKINHLSDAPGRISQYLRINSDNSRLEQYLLNSNSARTRLEITDSVLSQLTDLSNETQSLALQANDQSLSVNERAAVVERLNDIKDSILELANTKIGNSYLFAGFEHTTQPFDGNAGTFNGDTNDVNIKVSATKNVTVSLNGSNLFTGGGGNRDVFDAMDDLITAATNADATALGTSITDIQDVLAQFSEARATVGGRIRSLDFNDDSLENQRVLNGQRASVIADADMAQASTDLSYREFALRSSFEVARRLMSITLESFFN